MSDVSYVVGTTEYLIFELEVVAPELTFTASEWRAMVALCPAAEPFDPDSASWNSAVLETIDGRHYIKLLTGTGGVAVSAGTYKAFISLTKLVDGVESPVIRVAGLIRFGTG